MNKFNLLLHKLCIKFDNRKVKRNLIIITFILLSIILVYYLRIPSNILYVNEKNNITQETNFNYKAKIIPHILNPEGGIIELRNGVITKVTEEIYVDVMSIIKADNPIKIEGTKQLIVTINANNLWKKDFILKNESIINYEGSEYIIFNNLYPLKLNELNQFIKTVEEELELRTGNYTLEIKPSIKGTIYSGNQIITIDESAFSIINLSSDLIVSETENYFNVSTPIKETIKLPQYLYFFKYQMPVNLIKYVISTVYILFIITLAILKFKKTIYLRKQQSEVDKFNKKFKARLINVKSDINNMNNYNIIELDTLDKIVTVSDEKDCSIFKYENNDEVTYYIPDQFNIYYYKIIKDAILDEIIECDVNETVNND